MYACRDLTGAKLLRLVRLAHRSVQVAAAALAQAWFVGAVPAISSAVRCPSFNEATVSCWTSNLCLAALIAVAAVFENERTRDVSQDRLETFY